MNDQLQQWGARLNSENLPGFALTVQKLGVLPDDEASAEAIAEVVQPDAAMTVRILRLANSAYHNPSRRKIDNIQYACVVLGVKVVRNLAITAASLGQYHEQDFGHALQRELALSFHAAMQAQTLARLQGLQQDDNIYIAALLSRLGHWLFWCFPYGFGETLAAHHSGLTDASLIERELLGFSLDELTLWLLQDWGLDNAHRLLVGESRVQQEHTTICEAFALARSLRNGWQHRSVTEQTRKLVSLCRLPRADVAIAVHQCVIETRKVLKQVDIASDYWPPLENEKPHSQVEDALPLLQQALARDIQLQKQARHLRQLTHMLCSKVDVARCLRTVVTGVHRTLGLDYAFVILVHTKKHHLHIASFEGEQGEPIAKGVIAAIEREGGLGDELKAGRICWPTINPRVQSRCADLFGSDAFCVFPLRLGERAVGYVGGGKLNEQALNEETFETFCHFCDHALLAIKLSLMEQGLAHH